MLTKKGKALNAQLAVDLIFKSLKLVDGLQASLCLNETVIKFRQLLEIKRRRKGKVFLVIPTPVYGLRQYSATLRILANSVYSRAEQSFRQRLSAELMDT
jgi:ribosomal protein S7